MKIGKTRLGTFIITSFDLKQPISTTKMKFSFHKKTKLNEVKRIELLNEV